MASIDRHKYSQDIRKGAAKFLDNLNLGEIFSSKNGMETGKKYIFPKVRIQVGPLICAQEELNLHYRIRNIN